VVGRGTEGAGEMELSCAERSGTEVAAASISFSATAGFALAAAERRIYSLQLNGMGVRFDS
jgi:hypothetical protein